MLHADITDSILKAFYKVYNSLWYGFLEKVYENAMRIELTNIHLTVNQQRNIKVFYENDQVGDYYADLLVNGLIIVELKSSENICEEHEAQLLN